MHGSAAVLRFQYFFFPTTWSSCRAVMPLDENSPPELVRRFLVSPHFAYGKRSWKLRCTKTVLSGEETAWGLGRKRRHTVHHYYYVHSITGGKQIKKCQSQESSDHHSTLVICSTDALNNKKKRDEDGLSSSEARKGTLRHLWFFVLRSSQLITAIYSTADSQKNWPPNILEFEPNKSPVCLIPVFHLFG